MNVIEIIIGNAISLSLILPCTCLYIVSFILIAVYNLTGKGSSHSPKSKEELACLNDPIYGEHGYMELKKRDGLMIHYVANGSRSKPLMLFLHGFPEFWYMWKNQLIEFGKDYYAVAIDLTGYGESSVPTEKKRYLQAEIASDVKEFILELGFSSCILVGHDWGAVIAFHTAIEYPNVVDKLINMNVPHKRAVLDSPSLRQLWKSSYIFFFQIPYLPEYFFSANNCEMLQKTLQIYSNSDYFTDDEVDAYKYAFCKSGWSGPINYYRNLMGVKQTGMGNVLMPSLLIWGTDDACFCVELAAASAKYLVKGNVVYLDGVSHFVNTDAPDKVHKHMRDFLSQ